ncbi:sugar phosphate isomerase/epimerase family protein [Aestuariibacter salexigens]|uniref:sugar phosphate isomerase/epimerase family protein n=1 Tax=Aestuariibacter salexigens TaxID=226010 RepID=UPI00146F947A|nr:sugar phosphate isomerase/epimerase family protein [Aestuariibacter salexigens]
MANLGVDGVELLPQRILNSSDDYEKCIKLYKEVLSETGLEVVAFQSLFFGREGLHLFKSEKSFCRLCKVLAEVASLANRLGVRYGILGAPSVRKVDWEKDDFKKELVLERLIKLDEVLRGYSFQLLIEPVPECYGNNVLVDSKSIIEAMDTCRFSNIGLQLDIGCVSLGGGDITRDVMCYRGRYSHFHVSEANLKDFSQPTLQHAEAAKALQNVQYDGYVSVEMKTNELHWRSQVKEAISFLKRTYLQ